MPSLTPDQQSNGYIDTSSPTVGPALATSVIRRYSSPTTGQTMNPGTPGAANYYTGQNGAPAANNVWTGGDGQTYTDGPNGPTVLSSSGAAGGSPGSTGAVAGVYTANPTTAPTPQDEATIRQNIADSMQASVDAINANYDAMQQSTINPEKANVTGSARAINARSGLLDSDFGAANQAGADSQAQSIQDAFDAERQSKLQAITDQINSRAEAEIQARTTQAITNANNYAQYLQKNQADARQNVNDLASIGAVLTPEQKQTLMQQTGYDEMTFDAVFNAHKQIGQQAQYEYTNLGNGTILRTGKLANGQALPNQTFQYPLGPNDEFTISANGTPLIVKKSGNQITGVQVAPGFDTASLGSNYQFTPFYPGMNYGVFNSKTGQFSPISGSGTSGSSSGLGGNSTLQDLFNVWAPVSDGNDPVSYAAKVAQQLGVTPQTPLSQLQSMIPQLAAAITQHENMNQNYPDLNNPGALKFVGQPGATMGRNGFAKFDSPQAGQQALINDLTAKITGAGTSGSQPQAYDATSPMDSLARTWLQTGNSNRSRQDPPEGVIEARGREIAAQFGLPSDFNPATASASIKADIGSLIDQQGQRDQIQTNLDAADMNFQKLTTFMQQHGLNASDVPLANQVQQLINSGGLAGADAVGAQSAMNSALAGLATEYSQILARGGQRNETVDREAAKLVPGNISPKELQDVVNYIKSEGQNVLKSKDDTLAAIKARISGNGGTNFSSVNSGTTSSGLNYSIAP